MGIEVSLFEVCGVLLVKFIGEVVWIDLGVLLMVMEKFVQSGELCVVIVDVWDVVMVQCRVLGLEMWEDVLFVLFVGFFVVYIVLFGFYKYCSEGVVEVVCEWFSNFKIIEVFEDVIGWVSVQFVKWMFINNWFQIYLLFGLQLSWILEIISVVEVWLDLQVLI